MHIIPPSHHLPHPLQAEQLRKEFNIDLRVLAIASSSRMLTSETGIDLATWRDDFSKKSGPADLKAMGDFLANSYIPNSVVIDCTASDGPPAMYLDWMKQGLNIITPNKKLGSGPIERYQALRNLQRTSYVHFFYEVRVA
jgi:aspartokinase/homoserine dehydrogenase 1